MIRLFAISAIAVSTALSAGLATAQQDPLTAAVKARQSHMQLYAFNLGQLGAMAQGAVAFDAGAAQAAADNLVALTSLNQMAYWLPGTEAGAVEGSRAKPELWSNFDMAIVGAMGEAALAMQAAAGTLEGVQGAMGALGGACGACHEAYRVAN
jgi:cytochrome c556